MKSIFYFKLLYYTKIQKKGFFLAYKHVKNII